MNRDQLPTKYLSHSNWGAFNHASHAPQLLSDNYMWCYCHTIVMSYISIKWWFVTTGNIQLDSVCILDKTVSMVCTSIMLALLILCSRSVVRWPWRSRITPVAITYHSSILSYRRHVTAVRNADVRTVQSPYRRHSSIHVNNTTMYQS